MDTTPSPIIRGTNYGFLGKRGYLRDPARRTDIARMRDLGIGTVALNLAIFQETFASTRIFQDFVRTPDDLEVCGMVDDLHRAGMAVLLRPVLECWDSTPRKDIRFPADGIGHLEGIAPRYWEAWFASYGEAMLHYARLAARLGCRLFSAGAELYPSEADEDGWSRLIAAIRAVYPGTVVYDSHPGTEPRAWFAALDQLHVSCYCGADPAAIDRQAGLMAGLARACGRPVALGEFGARSYRRAGLPVKLRGGEHNWTGVYDGEAQDAVYRNTLARLWDEPWFAGALFWKWDETQDRANYRTDPQGDTGYVVMGKPAEATIRAWYSRPDRRPPAGGGEGGKGGRGRQPAARSSRLAPAQVVDADHQQVGPGRRLGGADDGAGQGGAGEQGSDGTGHGDLGGDRRQPSRGCAGAAAGNSKTD